MYHSGLCLASYYRNVAVTDLFTEQILQGFAPAQETRQCFRQCYNKCYNKHPSTYICTSKYFCYFCTFNTNHLILLSCFNSVPPLTYFVGKRVSLIPELLYKSSLSPEFILIGIKTSTNKTMPQLFLRFHQNSLFNRILDTCTLLNVILIIKWF